MEIRKIAISPDGHRAALSAFERRVEIWNLCARVAVSTFDTILDGGGERLAINRNGAIVVAAAWARAGVAGYDARSGDLLWQRPDLKQAQHITASPNSDAIYACFDAGPGCVLDSKTGATLSRHRGIRRVLESPYEALLFLDSSRPLVSSSDFRKVLFHINRHTFAILSAAFSPNQIAVSEAGGAVRCFTLDEGRVEWTFAPRSGVHCLELTYCESECALT